jgi:hypothetical protein
MLAGFAHLLMTSHSRRQTSAIFATAANGEDLAPTIVAGDGSGHSPGSWKKSDRASCA